MNRLIQTIFVLLVIPGAIIPNAHALDKKREARWTQWQIDKLKWEKKARNLRKEENNIPLEDRFERHWKRMDQIEKKHAEVAVLLRNVVPAEYSNVSLYLKDEDYDGAKYPDVFIPVKDRIFSFKTLDIDAIKKVPTHIKKSALARYRKQEARLYAIEERFWRVCRLLLNVMYNNNMEIMELKDESFVENVNEKDIKYDSASLLNVYFDYNLRRLNELERALDVMTKWLLVVKTDFGKITKQTLKADRTYEFWQSYMPIHFATVGNKWPVYKVAMRKITEFDRAEPHFEQRRKQIKEVYNVLDKKFKEEKEEFNKEFKRTQKGTTKMFKNFSDSKKHSSSSCNNLQYNKSSNTWKCLD